MNTPATIAAELAALRLAAERQHLVIASLAASFANLGRQVEGLRAELARAKIRQRPPNERLDAAVRQLVPLLATLAGDRVFTAGEVVGHPELRGWTPRAIGRTLGYASGQNVDGLAIRQVAARTRDGALWKLEPANVTSPSGKLSHEVTPSRDTRAASR